MSEYQQLKCTEPGCTKFEMAVEVLHGKGSLGIVREESKITSYPKSINIKVEALLASYERTGNRGNSGPCESTWKNKEDMQCHACQQEGQFAHEHQTIKQGKKRSLNQSWDVVGGVPLLVDTGSNVSLLASQI